MARSLSVLNASSGAGWRPEPLTGVTGNPTEGCRGLKLSDLSDILMYIEYIIRSLSMSLMFRQLYS